MSSNIVASIRSLMEDESICGHRLSAYIIYSHDGHQSEYTAECDKRREFVSKFTGSAGTVVITKNKSILWTDGRYHVQAEREIDSNWTLMRLGLPGVLDMESWLCCTLSTGAIVGTDPLLVGYSDWERLSKRLHNSGKLLLPVDKNLVDVVWETCRKPERLPSAIYMHPICYSGTAASSKIKMIQNILKEAHIDCLFIHQLDSIAWLLNLRGTDIVHSPLFFSYALVFQDEVELFVNSKNILAKLYSLLLPQDVTAKELSIHKYEEARKFLKSTSKRIKKIMFSENCPAAFILDYKSDQIIINECPVAIAKSLKNSTELQGLRDACIRDSAILCRFFAHIKDNIFSRKLSERNLAQLLFQYRRIMPNFVDVSFQTISTVGSNCAVMHYDAFKSSTEVFINPNDWYHCDSGAQYKDGTTDIARTVCYSKVSDFEKECYTHVIKALIRLSTIVFPEGTKGHTLDAFARAPLWRLGLDYLHGTGHGIGSFLNVHEGPQKISIFCDSDFGIYEGMILSNEPGYYENGKFGIHLENMMVVTKCTPKHTKCRNHYLQFETVTFVPFMTSLINKDMLTSKEIDWLNNYHAKCLEKISPVLSKNNWNSELEWLKEATIPI